MFFDRRRDVGREGGQWIPPFMMSKGSQQDGGGQDPPTSIGELDFPLLQWFGWIFFLRFLWLDDFS